MIHHFVNRRVEGSGDKVGHYSDFFNIIISTRSYLHGLSNHVELGECSWKYETPTRQLSNEI